MGMHLHRAGGRPHTLAALLDCRGLECAQVLEVLHRCKVEVSRKGSVVFNEHRRYVSFVLGVERRAVGDVVSLGPWSALSRHAGRLMLRLKKRVSCADQPYGTVYHAANSSQSFLCVNRATWKFPNGQAVEESLEKLVLRKIVGTAPATKLRWCSTPPTTGGLPPACFWEAVTISNFSPN